MRIIAGKYKGKVLHSFEADNIRPTSDMVKEAICSKLQFDFPGVIVLDLFGGTGNFGFETISRGAGEVYICDNNDNNMCETERGLNNLTTDKDNNERLIREKSTEKGSLQNSVSSYDDIEETFNRQFSCNIKRNILMS